jgi:isoleucyl-tRNA synthetase
VNVKELEYIPDTSGLLVKKIKPNFKTLGPRYGKLMKDIVHEINTFGQEEIARFEAQGSYELTIGDTLIVLKSEDVEITSEDIEGWLVASEGRLTVALDLNITRELKDEGIAREFVNRIQNLRKESGFEVTDKIAVEIRRHELIDSAVEHFNDYIAAQTLARSVKLVDMTDLSGAQPVEIEENVLTHLRVSKI